MRKLLNPDGEVNPVLKLKILLPHSVFLQKEVQKLIAEGENGFFCLKPRHIDFVSALIPGIFMLTDKDGQEEFLALNEGILVKCGGDVLVSTQDAMRGPSLEELRDAVVEKFKKMNEEEQAARAIIAKLEVDTIRRFLDLGGKSGEAGF